MATRIRTLNFLPDIFRTPTNSQFLGATLDQIVDQPNTMKIEGYVGSKFGYGVNAKDYYVVEPTKTRTDYQLEPGVVFTKADTSTAQDFISYPGIIDAIKLAGGVTNNNDRLFNSQFYSWDSFTNLDPLINYTQYYWLSEGPPAVTVSTNTVYNSGAYVVTSLPNGYEISSDTDPIGSINPSLTLLRGGTYTFQVNQTTQFWIQGQPGITGYDPAQPNIQTRDVLGVTNNGANVGLVTFAVPYQDAQDQYIFPGNNLVDVVSNKPFDQVDGKLLSEIGDIDGLTSLEGKTVMFYGDASASAYFYQITYTLGPTPSDPIIILIPNSGIPTNEKITATSGTTYIGRNFYRSSAGLITIIPYLSSLLDTLYYQDGTFPNKVGVIKLIESNYTDILDIDTIIGKKTYTSPNGVVFTNGLKVSFSGNITPANYSNNEYYVQGVGTAISLIPVTALTVPEAFTKQSASYVPYDTTPYDTKNYDAQLYVPIDQDYITISRDSIDRNPWSRSNRWFHIDVINATANYNNDPTIVDRLATQANKAKRPIIEFYPNLGLFNTGVVGKAPVDFIDIRTTDAFNQVAGQIIYYPDVEVFTAETAIITAATSATSTTIQITSSSILPGSGSFAVGQYITDSTNVLPYNTTISAISSSIGVLTITVEWSTPTTIVPIGAASLIANPNPNDNYAIFDGARIVFTNDTNINVRNKIYVARFSVIVPNVQTVITLTEADDGLVLPNEQTVAYKGYYNQGKGWHFDGLNWYNSQQKTTVNQPPLFDIFDAAGVSLGDPEVYAGTSFKGNKLFAYAIGSGTNDAILGFPLKYVTIGGLVGDISFDVSLNADTFNYVRGSNSITQQVNTGYVYNYSDATTQVRQLGWQTAVAPSRQYQLFSADYNKTLLTQQSTVDPLYPDTTTIKNVFVVECDIAADLTSIWPYLQVSRNNDILAPAQYTSIVSDTTTTVIIEVDEPLIDTVYQIAILSNQVSATAFYQIPINLNNNPLNEELTSLNVGDIRGQYQSIFYNNPDTTGEVFGPNNYRDLGNLVPWGNKIIQNSASLVLPGTFLRKPDHNLILSLQYNSQQYITFKGLLVDTVNNTAYDTYTTPANALDDALEQMSSSKLESGPFFWSDMIPSKAAYITNVYRFANALDVSIYPLSQVYNFETANYNGVLVYLTRNNIITQLITGVDYTVSTTAPTLTIETDLLPNDLITIKQYNQTYGSYVPNTPTKLGLYPAFIPSVILDANYTQPTYFIKGHDGSYNKLYGEYIDGVLTDLRDQVLLEFELRVYNNLKLSNTIPIRDYDVLPGFFRTSEYSFSEVLSIYEQYFLNWVGQNRIEYKPQFYSSSDQYTYNYNQSGNKINQEQIPVGNWRGIYQYFYDTASPDTAPWEMLGFANQPTWWTSRYGPAPYTSDNLILWGDLAAGINWNNGDPIVIPQAVRPQLLQVLPVDSAGNLVSPFVSVVGNYDQRTFNNDWRAGDVGPTEFSYRRSSSWPFDLMKILALTKPANFFNLGVDVDNYKYSTEFNQYLVNERSHLVISDIEIYGTGTAKTSYINWIVDYEKQVGIDATTNITTLLDNLDVRLVYRLAGFSDKTLLRFFVEKGTPNSRNASLMIPDESYAVLLYDNQPFEQIVYSSVIIQKTINGWKVFGNSQSRAYFTINPPKIDGRYDTISIENLSVQAATNYQLNREVIIPYGTEFYNVQDVSQFIASYGAYLSSQGVLFDQIESGLQVSWNQMIAEFLYWAQSGWQVGSIVNINPAANLISINQESAIVQPLTLQRQNFVLNQNLYPIQSIDLSVVRDGTLFTAQTLNQGDTVAYGQFNMSAIEHGIVFDNVTLFNDIIYNLITGLRQNRIFLRGTKSAEWNGTLDAQGFILNQDNIKEWSKETKYTTGEIVKFKNKYWVALVKLQASETFQEQFWKRTDYNEIQKGLLPNSSTRSYESTLYYDTNYANLEQDADLLSFSLIGYRPRDYLAVADLTDITQINVYKNLIKEKGTRTAVNTFKGASLAQGDINYDVYENWAIKSGEFGGVLNNNFIDFRLNQSELTGNPSIVGLTTGVFTTGVQQEVPLYSVFNYGRPITDPNVLATLPTDTPDKLFPSAGYPNFDDVKTYSYFYSGLNNAVVPLSRLYVGEYLWVADFKGTWQVFTPRSIGQVINVINNLNSTITVQFNAPHNLVKYQPFAIINFNTNIDGYYIVTSVLDPTRVTVALSLSSATLNITGTGIGVAFTSQRVEKPSDIAAFPVNDNEFIKTKVWVDENNDGSWAVYRKSLNYQYTPEKSEIIKANSVTFGNAVAYTSDLGYLISDATLGEVYRYTYNSVFERYDITQTIVGDTTFGTTIGYGGSIFAISQPTGATTSDRIVNVYNLVTTTLTNALQLIQTITAPEGVTNWGTAITVSGDQQWLYIGAYEQNVVYTYKFNAVTDVYDHVATIALATSETGDNFGYSLSTNYYGNTLVVGAPGQNYNATTNNWGYTYVFNRLTQTFEFQFDQAPSFTLAFNPTTISVAVNGTTLEVTEYTLTNNVVSISKPLNTGDIIIVSGNQFVLMQELTTQNQPRIGVQFGYSLDTNNYGTEILVGAPFEVNASNQEGAVYRYTTSGGAYGYIVGSKECYVYDTTTIMINGYQVTIPTGNAASTAGAINAAKITNVTASASANILTIRLVNVKLALMNDKLNLQVLQTQILDQLGITVYTQTQTINDPHQQSRTQFGTTVRFNELGSFVVSAPVAARYSHTTFDMTDDENFDNDTLFDNNTTQWVDRFRNAGAVYMYDYLSVYNENLHNVGKFVYAQSVDDKNEDYGAQPYYGTALDFNSNNVVIGTPGFKPGTTNGQVVVYDNSTGVQNWATYRYSAPVVDTDAIQNVQLYSAITNNTLENLDYIDPLQGKILGVVRENLDVVSNADPAVYNSPTANNQGALVWGERQLGQLWYNTSTTRFVNYHQNDSVTYNSKWWGRVFPGSNVQVLSWITSDQLPVNYTGPGTPYDITSYSIEYTTNSTGALVPVYFYWVRNTNIIFSKTGKTLSDTVCESYIGLPTATGIAYMAPIQPNVFGLYNSGDYINANDSVLHIGFATSRNDDVSHSSYNLIKANYASDFLPGLPGVGSAIEPESLYLKMIDSLAGVDTAGGIVPDPFLPKPVQSGILSRPRQSFFYNRFKALQNYLEYANAVLAQFPILEIRNGNLPFLYKVGEVNKSTDPVYNTDPASPYYSPDPWTGPIIPFYDTTDYWTPINWWATGYNDNTKSSLLVPLYSDLSTIANPQNGLIVTVAENGTGSQETYRYVASVTDPVTQITTPSEWVRIGLQNGTIKFNSSLWDYATARIGFGDSFFDTQPYDYYPSAETRNIIRSLNEEIYIGELLIFRNKSLILLFEYIQSETVESQNYMPWLNKTSFIDVAHTIRELLPLRVFRSDNQVFLSGYINEAKPYHVVIKDFIFNYTRTDLYDSDITDFDLPAKYNTNYDQFITPMLVYSGADTINEFLPTDPIWQSLDYTKWYNNYGLSLSTVYKYPMTTVASYLNLVSDNLYVNNVSGFPVTGTVLIGTELIGYTGIDTAYNILTGLTRGVKNTQVQNHIYGEQIYIDLPPVLVLNSGRGYTVPPRVTAYIDTSIYPAPRVAAILAPIMSLDKVIGVQVVNPGSGYAVLPEIIFEPALTENFASTGVDTSLNYIALTTTGLVTGDLVRYDVGTDTEPVGGLQVGAYYYVNLLQNTPTNVIALYNSYVDAVQDHNRVNLYTQGSGDNNKLELTAIASCTTTSQPVRENITTLRFDRTSYNSSLQTWQPGQFYGSKYTGDLSRTKLTSSSVLLQSTNPLISNILASAQGQTFEILEVRNVETYTWSSRLRTVFGTTSPDRITVMSTTGGDSLNPTLGFYVDMPIKFEGEAFGGLSVGVTYYVTDIYNNLEFSVSETIGGMPITLTTESAPSAGLLAITGTLTNQTVIKLFYPGILKTTATTKTTNIVTVPLLPTGLGGTQGFYTGLPIYFTGKNIQAGSFVIGQGYTIVNVGTTDFTLCGASVNEIGIQFTATSAGTGTGVASTIFGDVIANQEFYVTTIIDAENFTMSYTSTPTETTLSATTAGTNYVTIESRNGFSVNDPIIFTNMQIAGTSVTDFGNIQAGVVYYVQSIISNTQIQISTQFNGAVLSLTTVAAATDTDGTITNQNENVQLSTAIGEMTLVAGLPISPGQINGQRFAFYPTSNAYTGVSGITSDLLTRTTTAAVSTNDGLYLATSTGGISDVYVNMPFRVQTAIGGLLTGTTYYVRSTDTLNTIVTNTTTSTNELTCTTTAGFYSGMAIKFSGTVFGGVVPNLTYYVLSIVDGNTFTISNEIGGTEVNLSTVSGSMQLTGEQYITVKDGVGSQVSLSDDIAFVTLVQYPLSAPTFNVGYTAGGYFVQVATAGTGYAVNNTITVDGALLGGESGTNDLTMTVYEISSIGEIVTVISAGAPAGINANYYLKVISENECELYYNSSLSIPVPGSAFPFNGITQTEVTGVTASTNEITVISSAIFAINDPVVFTGDVFGGIVIGETYYIKTKPTLTTVTISTFPNGTVFDITADETGNCVMATVGDVSLLPDPFYATQSIVIYNNKVYQCVVSNNDDDFVFRKWELMDSGSRELNALDRIVGYYQPTINMPGLDLTQLVANIVYPNNTYLDNAFAPADEYPYDTLLKDNTFTQVNDNIYIVQGDEFTAGYGPEELVPGIVTDNLTMLVKTRPGSNWESTVYQNVGYGVVSTEITPAQPDQVLYSFVNAVINPIQISVFDIDTTTDLSVRLYDYTVDWINKVVTLAAPLAENHILRIDAYEVGNGDQLIRSNSQTNPFFLNEDTQFSEIYLDCRYSASITNGSGLILPGTEPSQIEAIETSATDNTILCLSVSSFTLNEPITFQGAVFGGVALDTTYYVKTASAITDRITISDTLVAGVAGPTLTLTSATGSMQVITQADNGLVWTDPIIVHNGDRLTLGEQSFVTQTKSGTDSIVCTSTAHFDVNDKVTFSATMFGSVIEPNTVYYIATIVDDNDFTISETLGGPTLTLTDATGAAFCITADYAIAVAGNEVGAARPGISAKIVFPVIYTESDDYVSFAVFGQTVPQQYGYTLPETQTYTGTGALQTFPLYNYASGDNPNNAIVEIDGLRLLNTEYIIDAELSTITFNTAPLLGANIAVTTYNLTDRQYFSTQYDITGNIISSIVGISNAITVPLANTPVYSSTSVGNLITCASTSNFIVNQPIQFFGTAFGNILTDGTVYFVLTVDSLTEFTRSETQGGAAFDPGTDSGIMLGSVGGQPAIRVTTQLANEFVTNDLVVIDATSGSVQLNNNSYYVHVISPTQFDLYTEPYDPAIDATNYPVTQSGTYTGGGFTWLDGMFTLTDVVATGTSSIDNTIIVPDTAGLIVDTPVFFTEQGKKEGDTTLGGLIIGQEYYIRSITNTTKFKVSETRAGAEVILTTDAGSMNVTQWEQLNVDRLWVTVNGYRVPSSSLRLNPNNNLSILVQMAATDSVIITNMIPTATPNELVYIQNINKDSVPGVFRANSNTRTWLTEPLLKNDTYIFMSDVGRVTDTVIQNAVAPAPIDDAMYIPLQADRNTICQVVLYNETSGEYLFGGYEVVNIATAPVLKIIPTEPISGTIFVSEGNNLVITITMGKLLFINGEYIAFSQVNYGANSVGGLQRGINGTGIQPITPTYSEVYGLLAANLLPEAEYNVTWNPIPGIYNTVKGDPLQIADTTAANFLKGDIP